jgi:hypothetical protein
MLTHVGLHFCDRINIWTDNEIFDYTSEVGFVNMYSTAMEINSFCSPVIYRCCLSPSSGHVDNTQQRYRADNQARPYIDP